jgi:hypothetical protein
MHLVFNAVALKGELIAKGKRHVHGLTDQVYIDLWLPRLFFSKDTSSS